MDIQPNLAIFDLDYTLTKRGTWGRFVIKTVRWKPWLWLPLAISAARHQWRYKKGEIPRIRVKQAMMRWSMVGKSRVKMENLAEAFAKAEVQAGLRPGAIRVLEAHKAAGDHIIIASAAVDIIVAAISKHLNIRYWVATDMKWEGDRLAPDFASANCYAEEKLSRVLGLLRENPKLKHNNTIITFYSDSYSDIDMFNFCDISVAVNPDRKLRGAAESLGIKIVDWNT